MINFLVGNSSVVLQQIVILRASGCDKLLHNGLYGSATGLNPALFRPTKISESWSSGMSVSFAP